MAVFTVPPTLQSFGEVVAQEFERAESKALPTFVSAEVGNATPRTAFRSLELAVPTLSGIAPAMQADVQTACRSQASCRRQVACDDDLLCRGPQSKSWIGSIRIQPASNRCSGVDSGSTS